MTDSQVQSHHPQQSSSRIPSEDDQASAEESGVLRHRVVHYPLFDGLVQGRLIGYMPMTVVENPCPGIVLAVGDPRHLRLPSGDLLQEVIDRSEEPH